MFDNQEPGMAIFDGKSIEQLSPEKKADIIRLKIKKMIQNHPEGLTCGSISEITGISLKTVRKHLDHLTAVRETYKKDYGKRTTIYFPNGKLVHPYSDKIINIGDSIYSLQRIENTWGKFIYIQEKKKDIYTNKTKTIGGIMVEKDQLNDFVTELIEQAELWNNDDGKSINHHIGR